MIPVKVDGRDIEALVGLGSVVSLVQAHLLEPLNPGELVPVCCVHGDSKEYPTGVITLTTVEGSFQLKVGVVPFLPVPLLVGRECPLYPWLCQENQGRFPSTKFGSKLKCQDREPTPTSMFDQ